MNKIKLSEAELLKIKEFQQAFATLTIQAGKVSLALHETQKELKRLQTINENVISNFEGLSQQESDFTKELETTYGRGIVNFAEGVFIPENATSETANLQERVVTNK